MPAIRIIKEERVAQVGNAGMRKVKQEATKGGRAMKVKEDPEVDWEFQIVGSVNAFGACAFAEQKPKVNPPRFTPYSCPGNGDVIGNKTRTATRNPSATISSTGGNISVSRGPTIKNSVKTGFSGPSNVNQVNIASGSSVNIIQGFHAYGTTANNHDRPTLSTRGSGVGPRKNRSAMSGPMALISKEIMDKLNDSVWFRGLTEANRGEVEYITVTQPYLLTAAQATPDKLAFIKFHFNKIWLEEEGDI